MFIDELENNAQLKIVVSVGTQKLEFEVNRLKLDAKSKDPHYICTTPVMIEEKPVSFKSDKVKILCIQSIANNMIVQWMNNISIVLTRIDNTLCYFISCKSNVKPLNRRSAYRVSIMLDGQMSLQRSGENYNVRSTIVDMSIFGIGLTVPGSTDVKERDALIVRFQDEALEKKFSIRCVAVRVDSLPNGYKRVGCRMAVESSSITAYLSEKQRRILEHDKKYYRKNVNE